MSGRSLLLVRRAGFLALLALLALPSAAAAAPRLGPGPTVPVASLTLATSQTVYRAGDTHVLTASLAVAEAATVDAYVVVQLPGGDLFSLTGGGLVPGLEPFVAGVALPAGFTLGSETLFSVLLPAIPVGTYTWLAALTAPGTLSLVSNLAQASWSFTDVPIPSGPAWLTQVNFWRQTAHLPLLAEDAALSHGDELHATYTVKTDDFAHSENPASPYYTAEGDQAARHSNGAASTDATAPDTFAIEAWMQGPFHALGVLDPRLATTGYGSYREAGSPDIRMSGWLDVLSDRSAAATGYPIRWPGAGTTIPVPNEELCPAGYACFWGESPDPLTSCPGYATPAGLPLLLQLGPGSHIVASDPPSVIGASTLSRGATSLDHCVISELDYVNPDPGAQSTGRNILDGRDAVVIIPRDPLPAGTYDVSVVVKGTTHQWSFTLNPAAQPGADRVLPEWVRGAIPPAIGAP